MGSGRFRPYIFDLGFYSRGNLASFYWFCRYVLLESWSSFELYHSFIDWTIAFKVIIVLKIFQ
jgi:hypothetical protein